MSHKKVALVILDGWGIGQIPEADAIKQATTPFFDQLASIPPGCRWRGWTAWSGGPIPPLRASTACRKRWSLAPGM